MTNEEEEYYDSIDDSEFESCRSFCNTKFQEEDSDGEEDTVKLEVLVPFYTGNVEVDSIKNESKSNSCTTLKSKMRTRIKRPLTPTFDKRKNRSYLTMFYARSALQSKSGIPESTRATCVDLSPKSYFSCDPNEKNSCYFNKTDDDDSESFYHKFMEKEKSKDNKDNTSENFSTACMSCLISPGTKLYSVSEAQFNALDAAKKDTNKALKKNNRSKPVKVCDLGGLGPNIAHDKLELLRKRQDYGRKVSQKNRIKMMENKIVQKLREEIRESNKF